MEFFVDIFFLSAFWMSYHCLLTSMVSDEKFDSLTEDPLYIRNPFSLAAFRGLSSLPIDYEISRHGSLWFYPTWCLLRSLFVKINVFHQIREAFWPLFLQIFFLPLSLSSSWTFIMPLCIYSYSCCPTSLWSSVHFFFFHPFGFYSSIRIISIDLSSS